MPAKNKTLTVYPDPTALAIVGGNSPSCNRAIECWARVLRDADLSALDRLDWNFLADILNGTISDDQWSSAYLVAEVEDAITLNGTDWRWYGSEAEELERAADRLAGRKAEAHPRGENLVRLLRQYSYVQVHAVLAAIAFFWEHADIDAYASEWWTLTFRVEKAKSAAQ